jgi:hypothetical protein
MIYSNTEYVSIIFFFAALLRICSQKETNRRERQQLKMCALLEHCTLHMLHEFITCDLDNHCVGYVLSAYFLPVLNGNMF